MELTIATKGAEPCKSRLQELLPQMVDREQLEFLGWMAVRALPYLDASARAQLCEAGKTDIAGVDKEWGVTPFGVPPSLRNWGGAGEVAEMAPRVYSLHKAYPDLVSLDYTLRAVNCILGTHPVNSFSYLAGVGTVSKSKTYRFSRGDNAGLPGDVVPGYIIMKPGFPERFGDFGSSGSSTRPSWLARPAGPAKALRPMSSSRRRRRWYARFITFPQERDQFWLTPESMGRPGVRCYGRCTRRCLFAYGTAAAHHEKTIGCIR